MPTMVVVIVVLVVVLSPLVVGISTLVAVVVIVMLLAILLLLLLLVLLAPMIVFINLSIINVIHLPTVAGIGVLYGSLSAISRQHHPSLEGHLLDGSQNRIGPVMRDHPAHPA